MPSSHRVYAGWTIERIRKGARKIGEATAALREQILESWPHLEQGYRSCLGIVRLAGSCGAGVDACGPPSRRSGFTVCPIQVMRSCDKETAKRRGARPRGSERIFK